MNDDRLIEWLRNRACADDPDDVLLTELAQECRDICLRNPNGYEVVAGAESDKIIFDVKLTVDVSAALERFDAISREIFDIDGVREVRFVEIPPALVPRFTATREKT